jgi:hypothetical protein
LKWQKKYDVIKDYIKKPITANKLELLCKLIGEMRFPGNISKLVPYVKPKDEPMETILSIKIFTNVMALFKL